MKRNFQQYAFSSIPTKNNKIISLPTTLLDSSKSTILYTWDAPRTGTLSRRYKRFLADIEDFEEAKTVYCPNTGPMIGLLNFKETKVLLSKSYNSKRKYEWTLEALEVPTGKDDNMSWVGIHSSLANDMVASGFTQHCFNELKEYTNMKREVKMKSGSRLDFVFTDESSKTLHLEVKSVTLLETLEDGTKLATFPDTVSIRAQKHVRELIKVQRGGEVNAAILFFVQRGDCDAFAPSVTHDPVFAELCATAVRAGVQLLVYSSVLEFNQETFQARCCGPLPLHRPWLDSISDIADGQKLFSMHR